MSLIKVVECSRDAMQGIKDWIPSKDKISYLQSVLSVGFDVSFLESSQEYSSSNLVRVPDTSTFEHSGRRSQKCGVCIAPHPCNKR